MSFSLSGEGNVQSSFVKSRGLRYEVGASPHENKKLNIKLEVDWEDVRDDIEPFVLRSGDLKALRKGLLISELVGDK
ncbi:MAG: hypothetical protein ABEN55_02745 [Bradymonadaceae bacterium]